MAQQHKPPGRRHILYPGTDATYEVDARYLAHINPNLVRSTVFDPAGLSTAAIAVQYKALYCGVGLRICPYNAARQCFVSFFGPHTVPVFSGQGSRWFSAFRDVRYAPKLGIAQPAETQVSDPVTHQVANKMDEVKTWVTRLTDADAVPYAPGACNSYLNPSPYTSDSASTAGYSTTTTSSILEGDWSGDPGDGRSTLPSQDPETAATGDQERRIRESIAQLELDLLEERRKLASPTIELRPSTPDEHSPARHVSEGKGGQSDQDGMHANVDGQVKYPSVDATLLDSQRLLLARRNDDHGSAPKFHSTMRQQAASLKSVASVNPGPPRGDGTPTEEFARDLEEAFGVVASSMRAKVGRVSLRVEFGRICMTDPVPGQLAFNAPNEKADGWRPRDITAKLNASEYPVFFTKVVSTLGSDADYLAGLGGSDGLMWTDLQRRVVYDFTCKRTLVDSFGQPRGYEDFVVEVDGTKEGYFSHTIRGVDEDAHYVSIHCLQHNWDLRLAMTHAAVAKLETAYGAFARALVGCLVVP